MVDQHQIIESDEYKNYPTSYGQDNGNLLTGRASILLAGADSLTYYVSEKKIRCHMIQRKHITHNAIANVQNLGTYSTSYHKSRSWRF